MSTAGGTAAALALCQPCASMHATTALCAVCAVYATQPTHSLYPYATSAALLLQPPDQLQLWKAEVVLEDAKKLADLKVENDDVVVMCYANAGERVLTQAMQSGNAK